MPSYFPEGNTAKPGDNEMRSLQKIVDLLGGGSGGSGAIVANQGDNYRFSGTGAATQLQFINVNDNDWHKVWVEGTDGNEVWVVDSPGVG